MPAIRILLVDDDEVLSRALKRQLDRAGYPTTTAGSLGEARRRLGAESGRRCPYAVVLLDLRLPDGDGAELLTELEALTPPPAVAVLSGNLDSKRALELWGRCVVDVPKPVDRSGLLALVERLAKPQPARDVVGAFGAHHGLSMAELRVLRAAAEGKPSEQIAEELGCVPSTVATHWKQITHKSGLGTRAAVLGTLLQWQRKPAPS